MRRRSLTASLIGIMAIAFVVLAATIVAGRSPLLGIDLRGGVEAVYTPAGKVSDAKLQEAVDIINRRVNAFGVSNSSVVRQGDDIVIELPGAKNSQQVLKTLGETAQVYMRPVLCTIPDYAKPASKHKRPHHKATSPTTKSAVTGRSGNHDAVLTAATSTTTGGASSTTTAPSATTTAPASSSGSAHKPKDATASLQKACTSANAASFPSTGANRDKEHNTIIAPYAPGSGGQGRLVLGPADTTGQIIKTATAAQPQGSTNQFDVEATLTPKGNTIWNGIAAQRYAYYSASNPNVRSWEAIDLDGQVESAPAITSPTFSGSMQITGDFTQTQATNLAVVLKFGSLPVTLHPSSINTVSATLGSSSLRAGLLAGVGGVLFVLLYMIAYYRALGLVVVLGLVVGGSLLYAILTQLSYTAGLALTLSGVTGIIVSVGITVDSYVVYFERLKDEVRKGQTIRSSVERGFHRAFRTVLTADLVSFMAALILYLFTVGDVKGFAFTLGLSTLLDVATAYFFIRPIVILLGRRRTTSETTFLGLARGLGAATTSSTGRLAPRHGGGTR